jgi:predicted ATPase/DNA-binding SARP family transcriptional activator
VDEPWRIELLGGIRASRGDLRIDRFRTQKTAGLLAFLAHHPGLHAREMLAEMLWPDAGPASGRANVSVALSSLRQQLEASGTALGSVLATTRTAVALVEGATTTDVAELCGALDEAARASANDRIRCLRRALALYRGPLLPELYQDWIAPARVRIRDAVVGAAGDLAAELERAGDIPEAIEAARAAIAADALAEPAHRALMGLLFAAGDGAAALRDYADLARALEGELGVEPSPETRELASRIRRQSGARAPSAPPRHAPPSERPSGTVTFVALVAPAGRDARNLPPELRRALERHAACFVGDASSTSIAAFPRPSAALAAAVHARRVAPELRVGLTVGEVGPGDAAYPAHVLTRAVRLGSAAREGQILCSEEAATILRRELGPDADLVELGLFRLAGGADTERIVELRAGGDRGAASRPPDGERVLACALPLELTGFFGREDALEALCASLAPGRERLTTLTGPGGIGKTRLALEAARRLAERYRGEVFFAPLAELGDERLVVNAIAAALRVDPRAPGDPLDRVAERLRARPALVVLDNCEHLGDAPAQAVRALLERAGGLTCLATSRRRLGIAGERELTIGPLPTPERGETAPAALDALASVRLFVDRARGVRPDFALTVANAESVAGIVRRLEGIPLALALAAGRAHVLSAGDILARLEADPSMLASRERETPERHRTIRAAIEWSVRLLPPERRRLFGRIAVFRGGFALEAMEEVCEEADALDGLADLCECSLLSSVGGDAPTRFRMLETIREFAWTSLGEEERAALAVRHAEHYARVAAAATSPPGGPDEPERLDRLAADLDNIRTAIRWCAASEAHAETGLRLAAAMGRFWFVRGPAREGRRALAEELARSPAASPTRAAALLSAGSLAWAEGDGASARSHLEAALALSRALGERVTAVRALLGLGAAERVAEAAAARFAEAVALAREVGDPRVVAAATHNLALATQIGGDLRSARSLFGEAIAAQRTLGAEIDLATSLANLGSLEVRLGEYAAAVVTLTDASSRARSAGFGRGVAQALSHLAEAQDALGDRAQARALLEESLAIYGRLGVPTGIAAALFELVVLDLADGDTRAARGRVEEAGTIVASVIAGLAGDWLAAQHHHALGEVLRAEGDRAGARAAYVACAARCCAGERRPSLAARCLEAMGALEVSEGALGRAARLLGAASALRDATAARPTPREEGEITSALAVARSTLGEPAFAQAYDDGRARPWAALQSTTTTGAPAAS